MQFSTINSPFALSESQIEFYQKNNFIKLKHVLDEESLNFYNNCISRYVIDNQKGSPDLKDRDTYGKAFLQTFNLWKGNEEIQSLVFSKRLAQIAAELMQCSGVRLYHDQALFKESGGGITPWHADQHYWPFASNNAITAWIPLQEVTLEMGPLEFSAGSQVILEGRDLEIGDQSEVQIAKNLKVNDFPHSIEAFDLGEVSFHSGWIFHRAGANRSELTRKVMTIIYIDENMVASSPKNKNQANDLQTWCPGVYPNSPINSPLNPVLFSKIN